MKWILVTGTWRPFEHRAKHCARMVGINLARNGFGLITGSYPGVDSSVAEAFVSEASRIKRNVSGCFRQLRFVEWKRSLYSMTLAPTFRAPRDMIIHTKNYREGAQAAVALSDAAVMIGGRRGAWALSRKFIDTGKPVFPVPFSGGRSDELFQELLSKWSESPIPGLTKTQVLRLALPWTNGAGVLVELLKGTLADQHEIFVSYRRSDSGSAVGRLQRDLSDYFGNQRIFVDQTRIEPSEVWRKSISDALRQSKVGLVVVGKHWLDGRLNDTEDVVREEVKYLLENKIVLPILVDNAAMPNVDQLPPPLRRLPMIQARSIDNANWDFVLIELIRTLETILIRRMQEEPHLGQNSHGAASPPIVPK